jgi:peptidoglycan hydrolase CwlO-like protein
MLKQLSAFLFGVTLATLAITGIPWAKAYDPSVYNNLQKSRDALLSQRQDLQAAYDRVNQQINQLNQSLTRLDSYLRQTDQSLRDVESAMRQAQ